MTVAGLLLAAGAGRRLGGPKALLVVGGRTLAARGVALLRDGGCDTVLVVLGAEADGVRREIPDADTVVAPDWAEGLGASLRAGLTALAGTEAGACVVALVDQPLVRPEAVRRLLICAADDPAADAIVATYEGQPRNPVLLRRRVWAEVAAQVKGDVGARAWLRAHPDVVRQVPCDDAGSPRDVDTVADLAAVRALLDSGGC